MAHKCIITIIQNKRVALPFIFGRYSLPKMRNLFDGEMKLYHIFHDVHVAHSELESNRDYDDTHIDMVRSFIESDAFSEATIIKHQEINQDHLVIPSLVRAAEVTIQEDADFHLWLEDDAIVYDRDCTRWNDFLRHADVGLYRNTVDKKMINCAFFLSKRGFDEKIINALRNYEKSDFDYHAAGLGSQLEHFLWRLSKKQVVFDNSYAERHHSSGRWANDVLGVKKWLESSFPEITNEHLFYLHLDFSLSF